MEKKVEKWLSEGIIDKNTALKLLADIKADKEKTHKIRLNVTIYTVAMILLGLAVITFISANDWILQLLRSCNALKISLITAVTLASFWGGYKLSYENKSFPRLGNALILLSTLLIGGTFALIGQIYNVNANSASLMFIWLLSVVPVAYLFKNRAVNILSIILFILGVVFIYFEPSVMNEVVLVFLPVFCGALLYSIGNIPVVLKKYNDFSLAYKCVGLIPIFITLLVFSCDGSLFSRLPANIEYYVIPAVLLIVWNLVNIVFANKKKDELLLVESLFLVGVLVLLSVAIVPHQDLFVSIFAHIAIIAMIAAGFNYGYKFENGRIISLTNFILTIYLIVQYCIRLWSYLNTSLFFLIGGALFLSLGMFLEKRRKEVLKKEK